MAIRTATHSDRGHAGRVRPQLQRVAAHFIPQRFGVSGEPGSASAVEVLGEVSWLLDPEQRNRTPTLAEIDEFLDRVLPEGT